MVDPHTSPIKNMKQVLNHRQSNKSSSKLSNITFKSSKQIETEDNEPSSSDVSNFNDSEDLIKEPFDVEYMNNRIERYLRLYTDLSADIFRIFTKVMINYSSISYSNLLLALNKIGQNNILKC